MKYEPKEELKERIKNLLWEEAEAFWDFCKRPLPNVIRCNTLKISCKDLKKKLEEKWNVLQPYELHPEIMIIESELKSGELGKALEHQLGYYYVQELASMQAPIALQPKPHEKVLDLCAAPGSKTTQIAALMKNKGLIIANDIKIERIRALNSNLERCGCTNVIITKMRGNILCKKLAKKEFFFDKILVDAPCSGEGTIRFDCSVLRMWNLDMIKRLSGLQKKLLASAVSCLKSGGFLVYSTCTFSPEENEEVVQFALDNFPLELVDFELPLKARPGLVEWQGKKFSPEMRKCKRIWPQDNNTEGFFIAKLIKK
ncbi:MAG: RsmB/NOP family class I SAM-dependent RNA methyltransferase [Candidatus Pacearchaeota archaeon]|nr:RsmB/NOP family class I SAM-dependent RNA methyltransferase [Candidatus Pacearchaeota archaeon]